MLAQDQVGRLLDEELLFRLKKWMKINDLDITLFCLKGNDGTEVICNEKTISFLFPSEDMDFIVHTKEIILKIS